MTQQIWAPMKKRIHAEFEAALDAALKVEELQWHLNYRVERGNDTPEVHETFNSAMEIERQNADASWNQFLRRDLRQ